MANFISDVGSGIGRNFTPTGDALSRKIDFQRDKFLRGVSTTKHGKKEDPTYLHFKFIFDFGITPEIDPETFLAPSPLFRDLQSDYNSIFNSVRNKTSTSGLGIGSDFADKYGAESQLLLDSAGAFTSSQDFFYGAKSKLGDRFNKSFFSMANGYMGAQKFLAQRSTKRQEMLKAFKNGLSFINKECPYYFQSISGLDQLLKADIKNYHKPNGSHKRAGTLIVDCMESIDMRMFSLSELYRKAIYDYTNHRVMLPENLRKFRMWLVVTEIRNIQLTYGVNDLLNPFSIPSVAQAANFLDSFNSQTGLLNNTQGILQKSTNNEDPLSDKFGTYEMGPYAFMYQFDQCEFDFDSSYPSYSTIDNKGGQAVNMQFKINVGRVRDYKIQFNQLADVIKKDDNVKQMVLADSWGSLSGSYNEFDYDKSAGITSVFLPQEGNPAAYFTELASNFITNTVADLKSQGVSILENQLLGNIYGFGGLTVPQNAQTLVNTLKSGIPNPFAKNDPQSQGLGGPGERQYPTVNQDLYPTVPGVDAGNLGNVLPGTPNVPGATLTDSYPNVPGTDLGLPDRQYPINNDDQYTGAPGADLGVPGRVYPTLNDDSYPNTPGTDLGVPDRQYPTNNDDEFSGVPGEDLGLPGRVYPDLNDDSYPDVPGTDLGVPERAYPSLSDDEYLNVPGPDLGPIGRVYPEINEDVYNNTPGTDLGAPDRQYPTINTDEFGGVPGPDLGPNDRVYPEIREDLYPNTPGPDLGVPERKYPTYNADEYKDSIAPNDKINLGRIYPKTEN